MTNPTNQWMPTLTPETPKDTFTNLTPTMDRVRQRIADIGLRMYRVYFLTREWAGPRRNEGNLVSVTWDEITPPPKVKHLSAARVMSSGGKYQDGAVELTKISRGRRREELILKTIAGDDFNHPDNITYQFALVPRGQIFAELYTPASDAVLHPLSWSLILNPMRERVPGPDADVPI